MIKYLNLIYRHVLQHKSNEYIVFYFLYLGDMPRIFLWASCYKICEYHSHPLVLGGGKLYMKHSLDLLDKQFPSIFVSSQLTNRLYLPSATVVAERLCFYRCLSVQGAGVHLPRQTPCARQTSLPPADTPWAASPSPSLRDGYRSGR